MSELDLNAGADIASIVAVAAQGDERFTYGSPA
jgi:hypothetical protein